MRLRRPIAFILSAAVAASALTGCNSFSGHAAAAANSAQVQQLIEFIADLGLERDLRQALQKGGDLRQTLLTLLGLESAVNFNVDDLAGARPGQHAVQVWEVTAQSAEDAAALAASQIRAVLEQLKSSGVTEGRIGMVEVNGKYYVVVDVEVTEENTFEPAKPVSDDDDSEDTPSVPAPTATVGGNMIDLSSLGTEITATSILNLVNQNLSEDEKYTTDSITELDLSDCKNLTSIGTEAFQGCSQLTKVTLPSFVTTIDNWAFGYCTNLKEINLSDCTNLKSIGVGAFGECKSLTSIDLSGCTSLESIGYNAFAACDSLASIDLSDCASLELIDDVAFAGCESLTSINLSGCKNLTRIGNGAFQDCASLERVLLPESLGEIGVQAFWGCTSLTSVTLPANLTTIGGWAFYNCSSLKNIYFYGTVVPTIGEKAFDGVNAEGLTIHCPSSWDIDELKIQLKIGGLAEGTYTLDNNLNPAAYLLGL